MDSELERRYRLTVRVVGGVAVAVFALVVLAFIFGKDATASNSASAYPLLIVMLVSALGVVVYRRAKFSMTRLRAVAGTRGADGLIASLQHTTIVIALICLGIAALGFTITILTGDIADGSPLWVAGVVRGAIIALLLLVGCFPRRSAWRRTISTLDPASQSSTNPSSTGAAA